jgi:hypothetical protein
MIINTANPIVIPTTISGLNFGPLIVSLNFIIPIAELGL